MANYYVPGTIEILKSDIAHYPKLRKAIQKEFYFNGELLNSDV